MTLPNPAPQPSSGNVKGSILSKVVRSLRKRRKQSEPLVPEPLHHYLHDRVLDSSWLPAQDYLELMRVLAQLLPDPGMDIWEWMGRDSARTDYEGVYRTLLKPGHPGRSLASFETMWRLRHDTGTASVTLHEAGRATVELVAYCLDADEIYRSIRGTLWQTLHQAGAKDVEITAHRESGSHSCRWELSWRS